MTQQPYAASANKIVRNKVPPVVCELHHHVTALEEPGGAVVLTVPDRGLASQGTQTFNVTERPNKHTHLWIKPSEQERLSH